MGTNPSRRGGSGRGQGRKPSPLGPLVTDAETKATAAELARPHIGKAINALVGTIQDRRATHSARNAAAKHILDAAKPGEGAEEKDTREVSDLDLARWILSVLESAAEEADKEGEAA